MAIIPFVLPSIADLSRACFYFPPRLVFLLSPSYHERGTDCVWHSTFLRFGSGAFLGFGATPPPLPDRRLTCATFVSQCNATCGEGTRNRKVGCVGPGLTPVQADYCEPSSQPHVRLSCKGPPCHHVWITGEWSEVGMNDMRTDVWDSFGNILGVCSCVCFSAPPAAVRATSSVWSPAL